MTICSIESLIVDRVLLLVLCPFCAYFILLAHVSVCYYVLRLGLLFYATFGIWSRQYGLVRIDAWIMLVKLC